MKILFPRLPASRHPMVALVVLAVTALLPATARAQITYDAVNHAYFVTGDASMNDILNNDDVFVGKDNATFFNTISGGFNLTVGGPFSYHGGNYPVGSPNAAYYRGLNIFGNNSATVIGAAAVAQQVSVFDTGTINLNHGHSEALYLHHNSTANFDGDGAAGDAYFYDNTNLHLNSGDVGNMHTYDHSTVYMTGGSGNPLAYDSSTFHISGGDINTARSYDNSTIDVTGGFFFALDGYDMSTANLSGGSGGVYGYGHSTTNITGGISFSVEAHENSIVNISSGTETLDLREYGSGVLNLYGTGFSLTLFQYNNQNSGYAQYFLSGTLLDGTVLTNVSFRDYLGDGYDVNNPFDPGDPTGPTSPINFLASLPSTVPEPSTLAFLEIAAIFVLPMRFRRK